MTWISAQFSSFFRPLGTDMTQMLWPCDGLQPFQPPDTTAILHPSLLSPIAL